jgi:hypothetical protein
MDNIPTKRQGKVLNADAAVGRFGFVLWSFGKALVQHPETEFTRDAAIRRFVFSVELARSAIVEIGRVDYAPEYSDYAWPIRYAVERGWIPDSERWMEILVDRGKSLGLDALWQTGEFLDKIVQHYDPMIELYQELAKVIHELNREVGRPERRTRKDVFYKLERCPMQRGYVRFMGLTHPVRWNRISGQIYVRQITDKVAVPVATVPTMQQALELATRWLWQKRFGRDIDPKIMQLALKSGLLEQRDGILAVTERFISRFSTEIKSNLRAAERGECIAAEIWERSLFETLLALTSLYAKEGESLKLISNNATSHGLTEYFVEFAFAAHCFEGKLTKFHIEKTLREELWDAAFPAADECSPQEAGLILLREGIKLVDMRLHAFCPDRVHHKEALSLAVLKLGGLHKHFDPDLLLPPDSED